MNIIQAWKEAKEGQVIANDSHYLSIIKRGGVGLFKTISANIDEGVLMADAWEIVKKPKKIVIENVVNFSSSNGIIQYRKEGEAFDYLVFKAPLKITLEWEE